MYTLAEMCDNFPFDATSDSVGKKDLQCFKRVLNDFCNSGTKSDAFSVYFCFCEMFRLFGNGYKATQKLLELLADHEYHSGGLLTKHRDHYVHSVYVFAIGVAIYANNKPYRKIYNDFYRCKDGDMNFLKNWGLTALFHDIGYPFQLAHEQIKSYVSELWQLPAVPGVAIVNFDSVLKTDCDRTQLDTDEKFTDINSLLAYGVSARMGYDRGYVQDILDKRTSPAPDSFMDHGYYSAAVLANKLMTDNVVTQQTLDVLTAILLHNSLNRYNIECSHAVTAMEHPLAYLLMLCDELQNWDREAFGYVSKKDPLAWKAEFDITDNKIAVNYIFDSFEVEVPGRNSGYPNRNVLALQCDNGKSKFIGNIYKVVVPHTEISATAGISAKTRRRQQYASEEKFVNLCDFAVAIHKSYQSIYGGADFDELPLETKMSNIRQAQSYMYKLELVNCFFSDKELDYPVVADFTDGSDGNEDDLGFLAREEHLRWVREKLADGWHYGKSYIDAETGKEDRAKRDSLKEHVSLVPYDLLPESEKQKDMLMVRNMVPLLYEQGHNIRIYRYRYGRKPDLNIAGIGHRHLNGDEKQLKQAVKEILLKYSEDFRVVVYSGYATGADQLIVRCANELGLATKAVLPLPYEEYIDSVRLDSKLHGTFTEQDEIEMRHLLAQAVVCKTVEDSRYTYLKASEYIVSRCDKVIALWDGEKTPLTDEKGNPVNLGGTYHCIEMARDKGLEDGKDIHIVHCSRKA